MQTAIHIYIYIHMLLWVRESQNVATWRVSGLSKLVNSGGISGYRSALRVMGHKHIHLLGFL